MPVYVYRNLVTNETFEHQQRITEDALSVDPRTGDPVRRVIQPVGIAFKGSGFYVNDSRSKGAGGSAASSDNATDKAPEGKGVEGKAAEGKAGETSSADTSSSPSTTTSHGGSNSTSSSTTSGSEKKSSSSPPASAG